MIDQLAQAILAAPRLGRALLVQQQTLRTFQAAAETVLSGYCPVRPYADGALDLRKNLFSTLFLAGQASVGVPAERLPFCGLVNQCMRAWVTGCDNLLDDEAKEVIPFDLPAGGTRFRSVLTIMVADRVFADLLLQEQAAGNLSQAQALELSHLTLGWLLPSGLQEHEEEAGARAGLDGEALLQKIHVPKTGLLFEAPLRLAEWLTGGETPRSRTARAGVRAFGLGCQILDDLVDLETDFRERRYNYLLALAGESGREDLEAARRCRETACARAREFFAEAQARLTEAELGVPAAAWTAIFTLVSVLLRVPPELAPHLNLKP